MSGLSNEVRRLLEDVRRVATSKGRASVGAFASEGRRLLERALRAGWRPRALLVGDGEIETDPELGALLRSDTAVGLAVHRVPDAALLELGEGRRAALVTALFDLPREASVSALLARATPPALYLVVVDVEEPGNVGALLRTALASGAAGMLCVGATDPFHPKAVRTSLGSSFKLPFVRFAGAASELIGELRAAGVHSLAAVARGGEPLHRGAWPAGNVAIIVGNEAQGLTEQWRSLADARISIDFSRAADSFGVTAAAAICLYEAQRRLELARTR